MELSITKARVRPVCGNSKDMFRSALMNRIASVHFPGAVNSKFTTSLAFEEPSAKPAIPTFRIIDQDGVVIDKGTSKLDISEDEAVKLYKDMLTGIVRSFG